MFELGYFLLYAICKTIMKVFLCKMIKLNIAMKVFFQLWNRHEKPLELTYH